jgi:two-component system, NarL family, response regulator FusR
MPRLKTIEKASGIRLLLVDHVDSFRDSLELKISKEPDIKIISQAGAAKKVFENQSFLEADVAVVDVDLPDSNGLEVVWRLRQRKSRMKIIILVYHDWDIYLVVAKEFGAVGVILRTCAQVDLIEYVRQCRQAPLFSEGQLNRIQSWKEKFGRQLQTLHYREWEVIRCAMEGHSNSEISEMLDLQENTVEKHMTSILEKLHLKSRSKLIAYLFNNQLNILSGLGKKEMKILLSRQEG